MIEEIKYNGLSTTPSDYECADGELSTLMNAVVEDGSVKPIFPPSVKYTPPSGFAVKYIHKVNNGEQTNYILAKGKGLYYEDKNEIKRIADIGTFVSMSALGNTLVAIASSGLHYILWSIEDQSYKYLGNHIPHLDISFGLQGHVRFFSMSRDDGEEYKGNENSITNYGWLEVEHDDIEEADRFKPFSDENKKTITEQVLAKVNLFIRQQTIDKGRFCFPFFIRYALRLYDGSLVNHSAPILMMPSTSQCPVVFCAKAENHEDNAGLKDFLYKDKTDMDIMLVASDIDYKTLFDAKVLDLWKDIVKSVAIYISKPIYTYDQNGECKSLNNSGFPKTSFLGKVVVNGVSSSFAEDKLFVTSTESIDDAPINNYYEWGYDNLYTLFNPTLFARETSTSYDWWYGRRNAPNNILDLPLRKPEDIAKDFVETSTFYLLKDIPLEDLSNNSGRTKIEIPEAYLQSLTSREIMTDDYLSNDKLIPKYLFVYNNRLNLANVSRQLFNGFNPCSMLTYIEGAYNWTFTQNETSNLQPKLKDIIKDDTSERQNQMDIYAFVGDGTTFKIVKSSFSNLDMTIRKFHRYGKQIWGNYLYYPNSNASKLILVNQDEYPVGFKTKLESHGFLNGSFAYLGLDGSINGETSTAEIFMKGNAIVSDPNKIYTSEINNPFFFPVTGINTIGTGEIYGISSAVKALSQGQFGQFPLYAFSSDGVWAMETSDTGSFISKQPITRDTGICSESITQLDDSVLFSTDKGLMLLSGSQTTCISSALDSDAQDLSVLPKLLETISAHNYPTPSVDGNFKEFVSNARIIYDYSNQRIIVANPNKTYAYVFSMKSKTWGMMSSTIADTINSYPEALAVDKNGALIDFSNPTDTLVKSVLVTRPLKLGSADAMKTVRTLIQRGVIDRNDVSQILYGSRDLFNWSAIASSRNQHIRGISGTPYKYFRIATLIDFDKDKSLYGCSVDLVPKLNNKLR